MNLEVIEHIGQKTDQTTCLLRKIIYFVDKMDNSTGEGELSVNWSSLISLAIDKVRRQKQRPTSDKIGSVILKLHPTQRREMVVKQLEVAVVEGRVVMKGADTYHNNNKTIKTNKQRTTKGKHFLKIVIV